MQLAREQRADAAAADHHAARALQGEIGLLHGELDSTLAGREVVCGIGMLPGDAAYSTGREVIRYAGYEGRKGKG